MPLCAVPLVVVLSLAALPTQVLGGRRVLDLQEHETQENMSGNATSEGIKHDGAYFVFLEVYMLKGTASLESSNAASQASLGHNIAGLVEVTEGETGEAGAFYHSEVVICHRDGFSRADQKHLEGILKGLWWSNYEKLPTSWWQNRHVSCQTLSYAGGSSKVPCSGVSIFPQFLSSRLSGITNADLNHVWKYIYGTADYDPYQARNHVCRGSCGPDWASDNYNPISRNCNFFSSSLMGCTLGLSTSTPSLGVSDMRPIWSCSC